MNPPTPTPQITRYRRWLQAQHGLHFDSYDALWQWSVSDLDAFWQSVWDYFELQSPTLHKKVLAQDRMPGAVWFEGAQVNYARQVLRHTEPAAHAGVPAIVARNERGQHRELTWPDLRRQVASLALHLQALGVQRGDRVVAYLPNTPEAMVAFLATASIGAIWSVCAPDMGTHAVLDRFRQIEPKVLIACDGVTYGGRDHDRREVIGQLCAALPSVGHVLLVRELGLPLDAIQTGASLQDFTPATGRNDSEVQTFEPLWVPFDHPLWVVYSSGTTGLPKPIVHGHGGVMVELFVVGALHNDIACSYGAYPSGRGCATSPQQAAVVSESTDGPGNAGDSPPSQSERFHWYSSTGWIMWNLQVASLLLGATSCIYDGNPSGSKERPDWTTLWRFAAAAGVTFFGAGAAFWAQCMKNGLDLTACGDLSRIRSIGSTGSPLPAEVQIWASDQLRRAHAVAERGGPYWVNMSGGTDFAGAFVGSVRELPESPGRMPCRMLGSRVEAWNEQGQAVIGEVGELVCTRPIPSMPLYFWNDPGNQRYLSSYFDMYPGIWRHGDWIKIDPDGACTIYGRSDATINRHGLRMGTSEIYSAVEALPEVLDAMVVDLEYLGRESFMPLFVVLRDGLQLDDAIKTRINTAIRLALSPRFVPDEIVQMREIPRTLTGKKQELPIKKILLGQPIERVVNRDAMANPDCLAPYLDYAAARAAARGPARV